MTALARALEWFIAPDPRAAGEPLRFEPDPLLALSLPTADPRPAPSAESSAATSAPASSASAPSAPPPSAAAVASPALAPLRGAAVTPPLAAPESSASRGASPRAALVAPRVAGSDEPFAVTSAAVLGRPQEVGSMAAAVALALRRETQAKVASVVVLGDLPRDLGAGGSGGPAGRRIAARLEALGLAPVIRGRLVWVALDPRLPQLAAAVRRVTLVAAPAVLAITTARTAAMDEALAEQDLVVLVTSQPDGALAKAAETGLPPGLTRVAAPLDRSPARALARAGVRAPAAARALLGEARR